VIVIGGALAAAGEHLLAGVREVVYRRSLPLATQHLRIVPARSGERAGVIGAAVMVVERVLSPSQVDELVAATRAPRSHRHASAEERHFRPYGAAENTRH
jgi:hypothetical protein